MDLYQSVRKVILKLGIPNTLSIPTVTLSERSFQAPLARLLRVNNKNIVLAMGDTGHTVLIALRRTIAPSVYKALKVQANIEISVAQKEEIVFYSISESCTHVQQVELEIAHEA